MPFRLASENATIALKTLLHAFKKPAPESPFIKTAEKNVVEIACLQNLFNKININQIPTK